MSNFRQRLPRYSENPIPVQPPTGQGPSSSLHHQHGGSSNGNNAPPAQQQQVRQRPAGGPGEISLVDYLCDHFRCNEGELFRRFWQAVSACWEGF